MGEKQGDIVYTPDWVAKDMLDHFQPSGVILDPCRGKGAFHDLLPEGSPWCEITDDRDFFAWGDRVDWVIGNPPYSMTRAWFRHSYTIADNLLYLIPLRNLFSGYGFVREVYEFGGIAGMRVYGTGGRLGFPMGNAIGAMHVQRGYDGPTPVSFFDVIAREIDMLKASMPRHPPTLLAPPLARMGAPVNYGLCLHCQSIEVALNRVTGTRDMSSIGESDTYPTGYGCELCA